MVNANFIDEYKMEIENDNQTSEDNKNKKNTSSVSDENNLLNKDTKLNTDQSKQNLNTQNDDQMEIESEKNNESLNDSDKESVNKNVQYRYFGQEKSECYNCREVGHISVNCLKPKQCRYCMGKHERRDCKQIDQGCFICGSNQHQKTNCPNRSQKKCYRCGRVSHKMEDCQQLLTNDNMIKNFKEFMKGKCIVC